MSEFTASKPRRSYGQYCALAYGMDVIGERWTMLLVRELLLGPKRYKDLLASLHGIGTNLLAARLRELEALGVVERGILPPPAGSPVYQLTEAGQGLEPVCMAIGRWGARFLGSPRLADELVPSAYFVAMRASFRAEVAGELSETYEFRIGNRVFEVRVQDGRCFTSEGRATRPDVVMTMDAETLTAVLFQVLSPDEARASGRVSLQGDPAALARFASIFALRGHPFVEFEEGKSGLLQN
ncbi:MAG: winged helix-turn-helix transcriptional regulator [Candidatus Dormibacter sp.]|uniref:winged helix-turn-helix transcriptional regulator n=1 Tax=Candidatus Dormibacter sp. TaxID=2973982 RepID=UPI003D9B087E